MPVGSHERMDDEIRAHLEQQCWQQAFELVVNHYQTKVFHLAYSILGNREQAEYHLNKIAQLAGTDSAEYRSLASALEKPPGTGLVY